MNISNILNQLIQEKVLTASEEGTLRSVADKKSFLSALVKIYEDKAQLYLRACSPGLKSALKNTPSSQLNQQVLEKTITCAYSIFLESDKFSVVPSLQHLLASEQDLLISLGLKTIPNEGDQAVEIVKKVFIKYVARYRLFRSVDPEQLRKLVEEVEPQDQELFPKYLLNALQIEREVSKLIKTRLQGQAVSQTPQYVAEQIQSTPQIAACLQGIFFYLGSIISSSEIAPALRDKHFHHLKEITTHIAFINAIAGGYIGAMSTQQKQLEIMQANANYLDSETNRLCLPALKLLGLPVEIDLSTMKQRLQEIETALQKNASDAAAFNSKIDEAKRNANQRIDQWRASVPDRPITFGLQIGIPFPK